MNQDYGCIPCDKHFGTFTSLREHLEAFHIDEWVDIMARISTSKDQLLPPVEEKVDLLDAIRASRKVAEAASDE